MSQSLVTVEEPTGAAEVVICPPYEAVLVGFLSGLLWDFLVLESLDFDLEFLDFDLECLDLECLDLSGVWEGLGLGL